jgi:demethylmenaquinone methyltransferase/2-methoxy-6-polyprenyl-1,4-benzoquinol methylase
VVCLESTQVQDGPGKRFHDVWQGRVVPRLGRLVTGDPSAYSYLPASVAAFPRADELATIMAGAGLQDVRYRRYGFGAVALHVGEVPR